MKSVFAVLAIVFSLSVKAESLKAQDILKIVKADFSAKHFDANLDEGTVTINNEEQTVTIKATGYKFSKCPEGAMCILGAPAKNFELTLPITSQEKTGCGDTIIAQVDKRPVDGNLTKIEITDYREMKCRMMPPAEAVLVLTTGGYNRIAHTESYVESTLELEQVAVPGKDFSFTEGRLTKGFPGMEVPVSGSLSLTEEKVVMNVRIGLDCKDICPAYMPNPIRVELPIVSVRKSDCGDVYVAKRVLYRAHMGSLTETMEIKDYSKATCEMYIKNLVKVEYSLVGDSGSAKAPTRKEQAATLFFNPKR